MEYSLDPANKFYGVNCSSYQNFQEGFCKSNTNDIFGIYSARSQGDFYLNTPDTPPYTPDEFNSISKNLR